MKRCPQCEFLYEDEQSLCDMDGALLVLDSRTLPNFHALATVPAVPIQPRRSRAVPAFATVVLALVLGMVYYVSTQRHTSTPTPVVSTSSNVQPVSNPAPMTDPAPPARASESPKVEERQPAVKQQQQPAVAPVKKPAAKTAAAPQTKPTTEPKKEDSKVGSILKKTGRILKKPFKF
jgi:outer membrane biosynthesis protein TonB